MDTRRFDALARALAGAAPRRRLLGALLAGALDRAARLPAAAREGRAHVAGPCGDGGPEANRCDRDADCCTGVCRRDPDGGPGRCRCRSHDEPCAASRNCCSDPGQELACFGGVCCPPERVCRASNRCCRPGKLCARGGGVCCRPGDICRVDDVDDACCTGIGTCVEGVCVPPA